MMSALVPPSTPDSSRAEDRERLLSELLDAVKQCQIRFGGRAELATESDNRVAILCRRLEVAIGHGLRARPLTKNTSTLRQVTEIVSSSLHLGRGSPQDLLVFWHYVREHLTRHEYERYLLLKQVWTDCGRGRAWLRSSLNERSLERYLHCMLGSPPHISVFYEDWAFLLDQERSSMLPVMAAGLGSILFAIGIDNVGLDGVGAEPLVHSLASSEPVIGAWEPAEGQRRRRRVPAHIISFDDDTVTSCSAPPTCLSSPTLPPGEDSDADLPQPKEPRGETERPTELQLAPQVDSRGRTREPRSWNSVSMLHPKQTLTPVNNVSVGELIPVTLTDETASEEDSLSVPSYSEDTDCAAAAMLATQELLQTNCVDFPPHETGKPQNPYIRPSHPGCRSVCAQWESCDIRMAVTTLLDCKAGLEAEKRALRRLLEQAQDSSTELKAELTETTRQHREKVERLEARTQALVRENELLKHQLRKYVGAVQMLKRDGSQAHEALATLEAAQPRAGESPYPDYHHEAREYEKKLIQVAEMHGELMEFNDRLHKLLQQKDAALHRLREELVDLRGPLPDDVATSDDDLSVTSDYDNSSLCAASRALVNIWIPSAFLTGGSSDVHHVYQVFIRIRDDEWNIYRRYAQFYSLHKELKKQDSIVATFDFPPKKTIGNKDSRFVEERRRRLQHYLRCVVNHMVQTNTDLAVAPDKDLLVALVPFFGEVCGGEDLGRRKRPSSRNPFSRLARNADANPQYTGL